MFRVPDYRRIAEILECDNELIGLDKYFKKNNQDPVNQLIEMNEADKEIEEDEKINLKVTSYKSTLIGMVMKFKKHVLRYEDLEKYSRNGDEYKHFYSEKQAKLKPFVREVTD